MHQKKIRFVYMALVGIGISFLLDAMKIGAADHRHEQFFDFLISIAITVLVWEGNLWIDTLLDRRLPWQQSPGLRILVHFPVSIIYSAFVIYLSMLAFNTFVCQFPEETKDQFMMIAMIIGVLISIILLTIEISTQFFSNWKRSLIEVEKYKAESLQAQLQNLKDQINPHFLFNNMSVLSSLVYKDQDKAVDFINQLSKVYRYLLDSRNTELVSLFEELTFIQSYTYLLQIRFDKNLIFQFDVPEKAKTALLPPMALQILIENAIKHNEVSSEFPLTISISVKEDCIEVKNNLQLRILSEPSSKTGLKNICDRYRFFTDREVLIAQTEGEYKISLPLLS